MATHSNILAWRIPWTEKPGGYRPWGCKKLDTTERLSMCTRACTHTHTHTRTHVGSSSLTRARTQLPCIGNVEF